MARSANQKLKLLIIKDYLLKNSDENHPVTIPQIIEELARFDIKAERKSLYDDLEALRVYGLDIVQASRRQRSVLQVYNSEEDHVPDQKD